MQNMQGFRLSGYNPGALEVSWVSPRVPHAAPTAAEVQVSPAGPVLENQTVTLTCNTPKEAPSKLRYSWYRNHVLLEDAHSHTLQLHSTTRADTGFYFCEVHNSYGSQRSGPVSVVVNCKWQDRGAPDAARARSKGGQRARAPTGGLGSWAWLALSSCPSSA